MHGWTAFAHKTDISIDSDNNNPFGYKDDTREMIQREWRVLEPQ
jgi:hypothetical protein